MSDEKLKQCIRDILREDASRTHCHSPDMGGNSGLTVRVQQGEKGKSWHKTRALAIELIECDTEKVRAGIDRGTYKLEGFLERLAHRLTCNNDASFSDLDGVWYLGGGYWRAKIENGKIFLINPDRTQEEIEIIERAMQILLM